MSGGLPRPRPNPRHRRCPWPAHRPRTAPSPSGAIAFRSPGWPADPATAWRAFHVNYLYFAGHGPGGARASPAPSRSSARAGRAAARIAEGLGAWVPVTFVLAAPSWLLLFGREYIYEPGSTGRLPGKEAWLNPTRGSLTDIWSVILGLLTVLSLVPAASCARLGGAAENADRASRKGMFARWTANWRGDAELEADRAPPQGPRPDHLPALRLRLHLHRLRPGDVALADLVLEPLRRLLRLGRLPLRRLR